MDIPKQFVNLNGATMGEELIKVLKSFIPEKNISERVPSNGVGKFMRISYPEFGQKVIMSLCVGNAADDVIYDHIAYFSAWIAVLPAENITKIDFEKSLNDTYLNMVIQCQCNIRDGLENALQQKAS